MTGRFITLSHLFVGYQDKPATDFFRLRPDCLFSVRDEGGDEYPTVGGSVNPPIAIVLTNFRGVGPVNHHLFLKRIVKQLKIPISLIGFFADSQIIYAPEKFRMRPPYSQPPRILPNIPVKDIQRPRTIENAIVKIILKNSCLLTGCFTKAEFVYSNGSSLPWLNGDDECQNGSLEAVEPQEARSRLR